jgi:DNA/RNA-binding domain of Phe-tRNA-synthetase-like protein
MLSCLDVEVKMDLYVDEELKAALAGVVLGWVTLRGVTVRPHDDQLWQQIEALGQQLGRQYTLDGLSEYERIAAVRALQKSFGFDPTRYRPSSEALLRRILKGQGLHPVNTAVDVNNLCSLEFLLPMCIYDLRQVHGQMHMRLGRSGEEYQGIGRQVFQMANKVIIADDEGVMGNTVSDSERTKVTLATNDIFLAMYAPKGSDAQQIQAYTELAGQRMVTFNGGYASDAGVFLI